jgi:hypothetical protein
VNEVPNLEIEETAASHNLKAGVGVSEFREYDDDERFQKLIDAPHFEKIKRKPKTKPYKPKRKK